MLVLTLILLGSVNAAIDITSPDDGEIFNPSTNTITFSFDFNESDYVNYALVNCSLYSGSTFIEKDDTIFQAGNSDLSYSTNGYEVSNWKINCTNGTKIVNSDTLLLVVGEETINVVAKHSSVHVLDGLVNYFPFDYDESAECYDVINRNYKFASTVTGLGIQNNGLSLSGSSIADSGNALTLDENGFSVNVWSKFNTLSSEEILFASSNNNLALFVNASGIGLNITNASLEELFFPSNIYTDTWMNFGLTFDGTYVYVYVDGLLVGFSKINYITSTAASRQIDELGPINGSIDELTIYNRAISPHEINVLIDPSLELTSTIKNSFDLLSANVTYDYGSSLSCSLYIDDEVSQTISPVTNASRITFKHLTQANGNYAWNVDCKDTYFSDNSSSVLLTVNSTPNAPLVLSPAGVTQDSYVNVFGALGSDGKIKASSLVVDPFSLKTNSTYTLQNHSTYIGEGLLSAYNNNHSISVSAASLDSYVSSYFIKDFYIGINTSYANLYSNINHFTDELLFFNVTSAVLQSGSWVLNISGDSVPQIPVSSGVVFFTEKKPFGWFNFDIPLSPGLNSISVNGEKNLVNGNDTLFYVTSDSDGPVFSASINTYIPHLSNISFNITDASVVNSSSVYVIIKDDSQNFTYTNVSSLLSCSDNYFDLFCNLTIDSLIPDGNYNITFFAKDNLGQLGTSINYSLEVRNLLSDLAFVTDTRFDSSIPFLGINWSLSSDVGILGYNITLVTTDTTVVDWFTVNNETDSYDFGSDDLSGYFGEMLFAKVKSFDSFGLSSNIKSSDGYFLTDNSYPVYHNLTFVNQVNGFVNSSSVFQVLFNFSDDQTGISRYEYAIGTKPFPLAGWNNLVPLTNTTSSTVNITGLSLVEGTQYFVSARAINGYPVLWEFSASPFYYSSPVRIDTQAPTGSSLTYSSGPANGLLSIDYVVGTDSNSGINSSLIKYQKSPYVNGSCGTFAPEFYTSESVSNFGSTSISLSSGYCYIISLHTSDNAGNVEVISGGAANNVSVDMTPPLENKISVLGGYLVHDTNISFSWTKSDDFESGIASYSYAISASDDSVSDEIVPWTSTSFANFTVQKSNLDLVHLTTYYVKVRSFNNDGGSTLVVSNPVVYVDTIIPSPLSIVSIGSDTSAPYYDQDGNPNSSVILSGENNLLCAWSYYDIDYMTPSSAPYFHACNNIGLGQYLCSVSDINTSKPLSEGPANIFVSCRDQAGNIQSSSTNTDVSFFKENGDPIISVAGLYPGSFYSGGSVYVNIQEASLDSASYRIFDGSSNVVSGSLSAGNNSITISSSPSVAAHELIVYAIDTFGNSKNVTIPFIVNSSLPAGLLYVDNPYFNSDVNVSLAVSFFNNYSYAISGTGVISANYNITYVNLTNVTDFNRTNISIDISDFQDGNYTITLTVNNSIDGVHRTVVKTLDFFVDTTAPLPPSLVESPTSVYDDENIDLYIVTPLDTQNITVTYDGVVYPSVVVPFNDIIVPGAKRSYVSLNPKIVNESLSYIWTIYDLAGNFVTDSGNVFVKNRLPYFDENNITFLGFANYPWSWNFKFSDDDTTQLPSDFNCSIDTAGSFVLFDPNSCLVSWDNPSAGTYELNITVDEYSEGNLIASINKSVSVSFTDTANISIDRSNTGHYIQGKIYDLDHIFVWDSLFNVTTTSVSMVNDGDFIKGLANNESSGASVVNLSIEDVMIKIYNLTGGDVGNLSFIEKPLSSTMYAPHSLGLSDTYVPLSAYAINVSFPFQTPVILSYNISGYDSSDIHLYKYGFNFTDYTVNFSSREIISRISLVNGFAMFNVTDKTGLFVLVEDTTPPPAPLVVTSSSRSSSSGSFSLPPPAVKTNDTNDSNTASIPRTVTPHCFDGILNQGEFDVDCGGPCVSCPSTEDSSGSTDSASSDARDELPDGFVNIEEPSSSSDSTREGNFPWWVVIALLVVGVGATFGVLSAHHHTTNIIQTVIDGVEAKEILQIANFIKVQNLQNKETSDDDLLLMGFLQSRIDLAKYALANISMVDSVANYLRENTSKGYTPDELCNWLVSKNIHEGVVLLAKDKFSNPNSSVSIEDSNLLDSSSSTSVNNSQSGDNNLF